MMAAIFQQSDAVEPLRAPFLPLWRFLALSRASLSAFWLRY